MRSLLTFALVAILATTGFGQSVTKINAAVKTVQPANASPEAPVAALSRGIIDAQGNVLANGKTGVLALAANTTIGGSSVSALGTITSTSADAFDVGPAGTTNPTIQIDASTTSAATGIKVKSAASTGGIAISAISSGSNESMKIDAKGTGTLTLNGTATGAVITTKARSRPELTDYTADGAITLTSGVHTISKTSAAAMTVAAPSSQDGERLTIISNSSFAHVITFTGTTLWDGTTGANTTVTMTAFKGSAITVIAKGSTWLLESQQTVTSIAP